MSKYKSTWSFLKAFASNPKGTGAILPSSKQLAKAMVSYMKLSSDSLVIELGPGTGVVTEAILNRGYSPDNIIAIEYATHLANKLKKQYPDITVIEGNAADMPHLLEKYSKPVGSIISSLPLRSLPKPMRNQILNAIPMVLSEQGRFIQFTYHLGSSESFYPANYRLIGTAIIWRNIPPAKIEVYEITAP